MRSKLLKAARSPWASGTLTTTMRSLRPESPRKRALRATRDWEKANGSAVDSWGNVFVAGGSSGRFGGLCGGPLLATAGLFLFLASSIRPVATVSKGFGKRRWVGRKRRVDGSGNVFLMGLYWGIFSGLGRWSAPTTRFLSRFLAELNPSGVFSGAKEFGETTLLTSIGRERCC